MMTFPQVIVDGEPLGGFQELVAADRAGRLAELARRRLSPARPRLAALADVGPAPRGAQLAHGPRRRRRHGSPSRRWIEEAVLEGALDAVGVAEVVDRRALRVEPRLERGDDRVAQRRDLRRA